MPGESPATLGESSAPLTCLPKAAWPEEVPDWNPALPDHRVPSLPVLCCQLTRGPGQCLLALGLGALPWQPVFGAEPPLGPCQLRG